MPGWKEINIDAGLLVALALGVLGVLAAYGGVQSWVDSRIDRAIRPVKQDVQQLRESMEKYDNRQQAYHGIQKKKLDEILERLPDKSKHPALR